LRVEVSINFYQIASVDDPLHLHFPWSVPTAGLELPHVPAAAYGLLQQARFEKRLLKAWQDTLEVASAFHVAMYVFHVSRLECSDRALEVVQMSCEAGDGVMGFRPEEPQITLPRQVRIALHAVQARRHRWGHVKLVMLD
jgi:hypothetical protein